MSALEKMRRHCESTHLPTVNWSDIGQISLMEPSHQVFGSCYLNL